LYVIYVVKIKRFHLPVQNNCLNNYTGCRCNSEWTTEVPLCSLCSLAVLSWITYIYIWLFQGFLNHVKEEHNMWSYMYYLIYLNETEPNDYTALDLCVAKQVPLLWTYPAPQYHYPFTPLLSMLTSWTIYKYNEGI